jgi:hypothetical protein
MSKRFGRPVHCGLRLVADCPREYDFANVTVFLHEQSCVLVARLVYGPLEEAQGVADQFRSRVKTRAFLEAIKHFKRFVGEIELQSLLLHFVPSYR